MKTNTGLAKVALAAVLAVAVVVPMSASAVPGRGMRHVPKANASRSATATVQLQTRRERLEERIAKALGNRARAFDRAASRIALRIEDVAALSAKAGVLGDVTGVNATLDEARAALTAARADEASAADMFVAVPGATDRRAAFDAAKAKARAARDGLAEARSLLRSAILQLESIVTGLAGATQ
jgi:hypothetical protein